MGNWSLYSKDLKMNSLYGDLEINASDIVFNTKKVSILKNTIIERYKTNVGDCILNPDYGSNVEEYIGRGIDSDLLESIRTSFRYSLTFDNFIDNSELQIVPIQISSNTLKIYTYISTTESDDEIVITTTYNLEEGFSFD